MLLKFILFSINIKLLFRIKLLIFLYNREVAPVFDCLYIDKAVININYIDFIIKNNKSILVYKIIFNNNK